MQQSKVKPKEAGVELAENAILLDPRPNPATQISLHAMTQHLTIEFPESAKLPQGLAEDQDFLRYTVVASLYQRGKLSGRAARELTGDSRRRFEEKMAEYGYPLMGSETDDISAELNA